MTFSSENIKSLSKMLLKLLIAAAIIYWLVSQNKLDYRLVIQSFKNPVTWIACWLLFVLQTFLGAIRWKLILKAKIKDLPVREVARIQWIGQFFSVVLPGAVTGDLVKIGYVRAQYKHVSRKFLILSVFIDRLAGLNALLLWAGISSIIFYKNLIELNPLLKNIIYINIFLFIGSCGVISLFFLNTKMQNKIIKLIPFKKINDLLDTIWSFSNHKKEMVQALFISAIVHILTILCFWIINLPFFEKPIELKYLLTIIPLGQVAVALPISPAGLGVGHVAFDRLFHFIGHGNGASLFNVYWVLLFSVNLCGIIPFILSRTQNKKENTQP
jgi:uncharacterized membrane protein YbhN (UPF0104 family)